MPSSPSDRPDVTADATLASAVTTPPRLPVVRAPDPAAAAAPRAGRRALVWALGLVLALGAGAAAYFQPWNAGPVVVAVETAALAPVTRVLAVNGRIAAENLVAVRALVGGTLAVVPVVEGDKVQAGAELARVDTAAQQAVVRQAVAGLDAALVTRAQAADTLARTEALAGNVTRTTLESAMRAVEQADQDVVRASAMLDQARVQLANHTVQSPMTGTVLTLDVVQGQNIDAATVLMTIADLDRLQVETDVDEAYATQIRMGQPAVMQLAGEAAQRAGRVSYVSQRVDATTGGLAVELQFDDAVTAPVGLTVTINIVVDSRDAALTVPRAAVKSDSEGDSVLVLRDGVATRRTVSVIDWPAARLIVTDGLAPGDVVIQDVAGLTDGQAARMAQP